MNKSLPGFFLLWIVLSGILAACGGAAAPVQAGPVEAASLRLPDFSAWSAEQVCQALPGEVLAQALGRPLAAEPQPFDDPSFLGKGCAYDSGQDGSQAYFAYLSLAPGASYDETLRSGVNLRQVDDFGLEAYRVNGADAEQLWVGLSDQAALVVAIGDQPNPEGASWLAKYFLEGVGGEK